MVQVPCYEPEHRSTPEPRPSSHACPSSRVNLTGRTATQHSGFSTEQVLLSDLPRDMMEEILSRLPPKTLIECKDVNEWWKFFISSKMKNPSFVNRHIMNSSTSSTSVVFRRSCLRQGYRSFDDEEPLSLVTLFHDGADEDSVKFIKRIPKAPRVGNTEMGSFRIYHHCNGIFCTVNNDDTVLLCNPELDEVRIVPNSNHDLKPLDIMRPSCGDLRGMGFGYDSKANDYKIIFLFPRKGNNIGAKVYDMSTNSWREIEFIESKNIFYDNSWKHEKNSWKAEKGVYCKGFYYWLVGGPLAQKRMMSFDMCNEVLRIFLLPPGDVGEKDIAVWNDSVVLFSTTYNAGLVKWIDIWKLDGHNEWRKRLGIEGIKGMERPLTFWKGDELLMFYRDRGRGIASYNIHSKKLRTLAIPEDDRMEFWGFYVESLVSVNTKIHPNGNTTVSL